MRKIYLSIVLLILTIVGKGQFVDDFNYTTGTNLTANGWTQLSAGSGPLIVNSTGLSYPNSPSNGVGFGVNMAPGQQVVGRGGSILSVSPATAGATAYMSLLVNLSAAGNSTGVNIAGIMTGSFPSPGVAARIFTRQSGAGFNFGLGKTNLTANYEGTVRALNTTYLVVIKYTVNGNNTSDDIVDLWVNPTLGAIEPPSILSMGAGVADATLALFGPQLNPRTAPAAPTLEADAVRVGITWASVTPSNIALTVSATSLAFGTLAVGTSSPSQSFNLAGTNLTPAPGSITVTAPTGGYEVSNDNSTWGSTTTIAYTTGTLSATPVYVRFTPPAAGAAPAGNITLSGGGVGIAPTVALTGSGGTAFYCKPTGSLHDVNTWGTATNGTGTLPPNFVNDYQIFIITNRATHTLDDNFQVMGLGSKTVVGDGTNPIKLILPANFTILSSIDNRVDVMNNATVEVANKLYRAGSTDPTKIVFPHFGITGISSTVEFTWNGITANDTVRIPAETYGNLVLKNGLKYFASGFAFANGTLQITDVVGVNGTGNGSASILVRGDITMSNSTFDTDPSADANRINLNFGGNGIQNISGGDFYVGQLRTQAVSGSVPAFPLNVVLGTNTNITMGTTTAGGFNFQQPTHNLSINGNTVTMLNGSSFLSTNQGTMSGTTASNLLISKTAGSASIGSIAFASGGQTLNNFTYNAAGTGNNHLTLNSPLTVSGMLSLVGGNIQVGSNMLTSTGTLSGGSSTGFIVTNGTGSFKRTNVGVTAITYPVGPSNTLYHPATITNTGTVDNYSVNVTSTAAPCVDATASVTATWNINEDVTGGSNCALSLDYTGAAVGGVYSAITAQIAHCGAAPPHYSNGSVTGTVATGTGFTNFSPFAITSNITVLPLSFISFTGKKLGNTTQLNWVVNSVESLVGFEIQRSNDGLNFNNIGYSNATNGLLQYDFVDATATGKVLYYRIKGKSISSAPKYSTILKLNDNKPSNLSIVSVAPNPTAGALSAAIFSESKARLNLQIIDTKGSVLLERTITVQEGTTVIPFDLSLLNAGIYLLKAVNVDKQQISVLKIIKQ